MVSKIKSKFDKIFSGSPMDFSLGTVLALAVFVLQQNRTNGQSDESCVGKADLWKYQDPYDCHGYFMCIKGKAYQNYCEKNEKFDEINRKCIIGKCPPCSSCNSLAACGDRRNGDKWRNPNNCAQYYTCSEGNVNLRTCSNGLTFNPILNICDNTGFAGCGKDNTPTPSPSCGGRANGEMWKDCGDCTRYYLCSNGVITLQKCSTGLVFNPSLGVCDKSVIPGCNYNPPSSSCGSRQNGELWKDASDCTRYYTCNNGAITLQKCNNGLVFNPNLGVCDKSTIPGCNFNPPSGSCGNKQNGELWRDASDCTRYYICSNGAITMKQCVNGLRFNPILGKCDNTVVAGCGKENTPTPSSNCGDHSHGEVWRDISDCTRYYLCNNGVTNVQQCRTGLVFNPSLRVCDKSVIPGCNSNPPSSSCGSRQNGELWKDASDCTRYYTCNNGAITLQKCNTGLVFNPNLRVCDKSTIPGCNSNPPSGSCGSKQNGELWRDASDCTRYYICSNGAITMKQCINGLRFNPILGVCDNTVVGGCGLDNTPTPSPNCGERVNGEMWKDCSDCTRYYLCSKGTITLQKCNTGLAFNPDVGVCDKTVIPGCNSNPPSSTCGSRQNGELWRDTSDCTRYYVCSNGAINSQKCSDGLRFNPILNKCDNTVVAGCGSGSIPTPTSNCGGRVHGEMWKDCGDCTRYYLCSNGAITLEKCSTGLVFNSQLGVCDNSVIPGCNSNPPLSSCGNRQNGEKWKDTSDCTRYYTCNNGAINLQQCNSGLVFNPNLMVCDNSVIPGCNSVIPESCEGVTGRQLIRDPSDCTKYFVCAGGLKLPGKCDNGFAFDSTKLVCMPKDRVQCGSFPQPQPFPDIPAPNPPCTECDNPCKGEKLYVLYRDPTNCAKVVICIAGKPVNYVCPHGKFFDFKIGACADERSVSCNAIDPNVSKLCKGKKYALVRDPSDCSKYVVCTKGEYRTIKCPDGKYFDENAGKCNEARLVSCNSTPAPSPVPSPVPSPNTCTTPFNPCDSVTGYAIFRDPTNCGRYFIFQRGTLNTFNCPDGKYFDLTTSKCERAESVNCEVKCPNAPSPNVPSPVSPPVIPSPVVPSPVVPSPVVPSPVVPSPVIPSPIPSETDNIKDGQIDPTIKDCIGKPNGARVRNKSHCRIYYICRNLQAVKSTCPVGQWFDDVAFVCNFREMVKCPAGVN